jgi:hypothetical protein
VRSYPRTRRGPSAPETGLDSAPSPVRAATPEARERTPPGVVAWSESHSATTLATAPGLAVGVGVCSSVTPAGSLAFFGTSMGGVRPSLAPSGDSPSAHGSGFPVKHGPGYGPGGRHPPTPGAVAQRRRPTTTPSCNKPQSHNRAQGPPDAAQRLDLVVGWVAMPRTAAVIRPCCCRCCRPPSFPSHVGKTTLLNIHIDISRLVALYVPSSRLAICLGW